MGKPTGFLEFDRLEALSRPIAERLTDFAEFHTVMPVETLTDQAARCMDCGVSFCHAGISVANTSIGCPLNNLIPEINDLVYRGRYDEAYQRLCRTHPFPEFTGRVCPALCEGSCTLGEHADPVSVKEIEHFLDQYAADSGLLTPHIPRLRTGRKVAIIGSGPAGLACAEYLNQEGEQVTVFERRDRPGGLLMYGIPNMKLDKTIVARRIQLMEAEGVRFELNAEVGEGFDPRELLDTYDALILAGGSTLPRMLSVPGADLIGVVPAVRYLEQATRCLIDKEFAGDEVLNAQGKDVYIVGGGDTGNDCVATALRQHAKSVTQFEIVAKPVVERAADNPWPLWPRVFKTDYGQLEAIEVFGSDPREFETSIVEVLGDANGRVRGIKTMRYNNFKPIEGTETERPAGLILIAMGFLGPERTLIDALGLETDARGNVATASGSYATSLESVFAAGDMRRGQSLVVWALMEGRKAAEECHAYLNEQTSR
ncbi:MAG: glutamate synthase subunit beta [Coriobacteriales bacterium]|jgi:glutamate synthase (NADPH/NADH) small chain|nr:glutamate synthase subunit beta [Coriobacteriales bacterium]